MCFLGSASPIFFFVFFWGFRTGAEFIWHVEKVSEKVPQRAPRVLPPFSFPVGPTARTKRAKTPLDVFQLFFTVALLQTIVEQTRIFAYRNGIDFNFQYEELLAYIGMNIAMGILRLPSIADYWTTTEVLSTPWFPSVMP